MASPVNEYKIVNNSNSSGIKFHFARNSTDSISVQNINIKQPGKSADNNYSRNWGGFDRIISVDFVLANDGSDKSTDAASKVTIASQKNYLMENVVQGVGGGDSVSDITYTLTLFEDGASKTYTGTIENISCKWGSDGESNFYTGSISFYQAG